MRLLDTLQSPDATFWSSLPQPQEGGSLVVPGEGVCYSLSRSCPIAHPNCQFFRLLFTFSLGTLMAGHTIRILLELYPIKAGPHQLQVLISSSEVKEIKGYKDIFVAAAPAF